MLQILRLLLLSILTILFTVPGIAQQRDFQKINSAALQSISLSQTKKFVAGQSKVKELAKKDKWIISETRPDGASLILQGISESGRPLYYATYNNTTAAITTSTNQVWSGGSAGLNLNGSSSLLKGKLGIWDGGAVRATHQELIGRIVNRDNYKTLDNHATHVAGTMIAKGLSPIAKGMAYQAPNLQSWYFDNDASEIAAAANSLLISNHSYGYAAGWQYMGNKWYWLGDTKVSETEDVYFGFYDYAAQVWDNIAYNSPYYLMVKAAGNSRNMKEPAVGTPYYKLNQTTNTWQLVEKRSAEMRSYTDYDLIPDHSVAKNILTVGAVQGLPNGYKQASDVISANFSSWGPTDDGRIKPDLVGNGIGVTSSYAGSDNAYASNSGTSMSSPNVSGSLFLLQEHYANLNKGVFMRAATLKGLAIHTTNEAGPNPGPDYMHGWGLLNAAGAARIISNAGKKNQISENTLAQAGTYTQNIIAAGNEPLRVTISWTDPAGNILPMDPAALNNRTPRLVNDLDVRITTGSNTFYPWILDPANPASAATTGDNIRDNVEQILVSNPVPGQTYTITITHKGTLKNNTQDYSLIISGLQATQYCSSAPIITNGARIENVTIGGLNNSTTDCTPYNDFTSLTATAEANQQLAVSLKLGSCANETNKVAKIFVDWNEDGDFNDANEVALTTTVLSGTKTFNGTIQVPASIIAGNTTRMRIVVVETSDAAQVIACGNYSKGETEDYTLQLKQSSQDVALTQIILPASGTFYAGSAQGVSVKLRNNGSASQTNIPVSVNISNGQKLISTLDGTYKGILPAYEEVTYTLPGSFIALPAINYTITASANLPQDQQPTDNVLTSNLASAAPSSQPVATATNCISNNSVILKGTGSGTIYWYDALQDGNLLAVGNQVNTNYKPTNNTYYAAVNDFYGTTATLQNDFVGSYTNYTRDSVYFNAGAPFILDKVTLNAGAAGTVIINLISPTKTILATTQLQLVPGVAEYALNFLIPAAGTKYKLTLSSFAGGATVNRNEGAGSVVYPYNIANLLSITGNSSGTNTYFYLYNWKIKATNSPSARVAVKANGNLTASATKVCTGLNKGTLTLANYNGQVTRWEKSLDSLNWTAISNSQQQLTFENLSETTFFRAVLAVDGCTDIYSEAVSIQVVPLPTPTITTNKGLTKLEAGSTITLIASPATRYLWSTGDTTASITIAAPGTYTVTVTNETGCAATSAPIDIVSDATFWTGAIDTDWFNKDNWSAGVPNENIDVFIPAEKTLYPVIISELASCKNLIINGNLTLQSGTLAIASNFVQNGNYTHQAGEVVFTGTLNHEIAGGSFNNLVINSSGITTLSSDVTVNGTLTIKNGSINTGANKIVLGDQGTLVESEAHFITGQVKTTRILDQTNFTQNFGSMGIQITTQAAPGAISIIRRTGATANNLISSIKRLYDIEVLSGKDELDATLEFSYFAHELNNQHKNDLALYLSADNGQTWIAQENSHVAPEAGVYKVILNNINTLSSFTAADRYLTLNAPVTLVSFEAQKKQEKVLLTWETITKADLVGMEVEISYDNENYQSLGFVDAKENLFTARQQYEFLDEKTNKTGTRYYRLKQLGADGQYVYYGPVMVSNILGVDNEKSINTQLNKTLFAYPNPTTGSFKLVSEAEDRGTMVIEIKNTAGQTVYTAQKFVVKGTNQTELTLPQNLKPGLYIVFTQQNNKHQQLKLILK